MSELKPVSEPQDRQRIHGIAIDLLEEYWKEGCQCKEGSAALCNLCQRTRIMLEMEKRL